MPAPPSLLEELVLHIGSGKTGTTTIQHVLREHEQALLAQGCLYPRSPGRTRHARVSLAVRSDERMRADAEWRRVRTDAPDVLRRRVRRQLGREVAEAGVPRLLLSDEALFGSPADDLERLRALTDDLGGALRVVVYLRRQDDHLASRYQQVVKRGETRRLVERTEELDLSSTYDYAERLHLWRVLLAPERLVVRTFERSRFVDGSVLGDFLDAAGLDPLPPSAGVARNESLDAEAVELLRLVNLVRAEDADAAAVLGGNHRFVTRLAAGSAGPTLTMPADRLEAFMQRWAGSNAAVARELLGRDDGVLFHEPAKSAGTTSEQRLEPARVDHFVALLELPDAVRRPLQRIAEREAAGGPCLTAPLAGSGPAAPPARELVLHMGSGKTGTSSIQRALQVHREALAAQGWLYPASPGGARHVRFALAARDADELATMPAWVRMGRPDADDLRARVRRELLDEVARAAVAGADRVLVSDEALFALPDTGLRRVRDLAGAVAERLRLVVYLRRQDAHLVSRYQQVVKVGETRTLDAWADRDWSDLYDYHRRLLTWQELLAPERITVRRFERDRFAGGSLLDDFAAAVGLDGLPALDEPARNQSLDADCVELLRLVNLAHLELTGEPRTDSRALVRRLADLPQGPTLALAPERRRAFAEQWAESNAAVARGWLDDPSGQLFAPVGDDERAVTGQGLSADRLEELLEATALPPRRRRAVQRVHEREAAGG